MTDDLVAERGGAPIAAGPAPGLIGLWLVFAWRGRSAGVRGCACTSLC